MSTPRAALFYGAGPLFVWAWGGELTSYGMTRLRNALIAMGVDAQCFRFNQTVEAGIWLQQSGETDQIRMGYAYSLGNTTLTLLQTQFKFNLVFCIALSSMAGRNNHPIDKQKTARACLVQGPGQMSNALVTGFDEIRYVAKPHLLLDLDDGVKLWALQEAKKLI